MKYQDFVKEIVTSVKSEVDRETTVRVKPVRRNNDFSSDGLNIVKDENIFSPTVFLDECYEDYLKGRSINRIVSEITGFYNSHEPTDCLDISYFYNFTDVAGHLAFKIINFERNLELLSEVPFERFLDFAVVCYCLVIHPIFGIGSILIKDEHLSYWNISKETLFNVAKNNACNILPYKICAIEDEIEIEKEENKIYPKMYMLTNVKKYYGASSIIYDGVLDKLSEILGDDIYILPSSVDELFVVSCRDYTREDILRDMVEEINRNYVSKESFLSNNIYRYYKDKKEVLIV